MTATSGSPAPGGSLTLDRVRGALRELRDIADRCADGADLSCRGLDLHVTTVRFMAPDAPLAPSYGSKPTPVVVVGGDQVADTPLAHMPARTPLGYIIDLGRAGRSSHLRVIDPRMLEEVVAAVESGDVRRAAVDRGLLGTAGRERGSTFSLPGV